ncbi:MULTISPECIES: hypothetical protein [Streptomyces]|uniref:Uncharacterized protein n=1 Tax=Streptomyces fradiae ATCC 10745 = DSM 40063 TaxID=1319510 RepID=A0ABQ6XS13_STRFR|nr:MULTISPECIES: hypothetical protein [Streptomyces]KAF0648315.1 hypothetical protein K701_18880 [Streptomyces fradiae ATCC 10745 = DSM 40063]
MAGFVDEVLGQDRVQGNQAVRVCRAVVESRTKRYDANGKVRGGTGGVCHLYRPGGATPAQRRALAAVGVR